MESTQRFVLLHHMHSMPLLPAGESEETKDDELARLVAVFKLLRDSGYTLKILPGTPEENAPRFGAGCHGKAA